MANPATDADGDGDNAASRRATGRGDGGDGGGGGRLRLRRREGEPRSKHILFEGGAAVIVPAQHQSAPLLASHFS